MMMSVVDVYMICLDVKMMHSVIGTFFPPLDPQVGLLEPCSEPCEISQHFLEIYLGSA